MIPEAGQIALIIALCLGALQGTVPLIGAWRGERWAMNIAPSLAAGFFVFLSIAFACLVIVFLQDDFSVKVVAGNSNSLLPPIYKFSAVWGNHEGSLLLWVWILGAWSLAVAVASRGLPLVVLARVLSILGLIGVGFIAFSLFTSNPFERLLPGVAAEGNDLNPLLQDPGLIIHPPLLYMGYVGLAVPFAFAVAALMGGRLDAAWAKWSRPWTNVAWAFLTLGIMLGSWWAYYELGWGGWWFWDPVENASFMPWLVGTALIHSLAVTEKRGLFRSWTVLLAIAAFSLSLLGTFLVRSGVLTSVHAFAADPERGLFILIFLVLVVGGSLTLFAFRAPTVASPISYKLESRESLLLANNLIFAVSAIVVLVGTLFPLMMDALGQGKYSVGPPYFNAVFVPAMALVAPFMAVGPISRWKQDEAKRWISELGFPAVICVIVALLVPYLGIGEVNLWATLAVLLAAWVLLGLARDLQQRSRGVTSAGAMLRRLTPSYIGMLTAHFGFALVIIGAVFVTQFSEERDLRMEVGDSITLNDHGFTLQALTVVEGPNYVADRGVFSVAYKGTAFTTLMPEKRRYVASGQIMTEAAIDAGVLRDLYIALGEPLGDGAWSVRVQHKPFIRWIWFGALLIGVGGLTTSFDRRYRRARRSEAPQGVEVAAV
jgi:cytochrome c-type biogenesis protein CcmF|tara:strand:- start:1004 stop:2977 length:1974 start_codon:yes stop_codon:yes gene_type:complete